MGASVGVVGASGYAGGELLRLLVGHPALEVVVAAAGRRAGERIADVLPHLTDQGTETFGSPEEALAAPVDVCFFCLPPDSADASSAAARVVVDLSDAHRSDDAWIYGLTEYERDRIAGATRIANPGCYPTAVQLALAPFVAAGVVGDTAIVDAISGVSGA